MLSFNQVSFRYGRKQVLNGINFSVGAGKIVALLGESGAGKSTIARLAAGLALPGEGNIKHADTSNTTQMIFQSSSLSLSPHLSVFELIAEGLVIKGVPQKEINTKVQDCLQSVGLASSLGNSYAADLSGGQRQRVNIARAIILEPHLIIADEPVSALDVSVQAQICNLLKAYVEQQHCAMLLIIHDLSLAEYMADEVVVLKQGKVVEQGNVEDVYQRPQHLYTQQLLAANGYSGF